MTTLELADEDVELFKQFRQYQDKFGLLLSAGVFERANCSIIIRLDHQSVIQKIESEQILFNAKFDRPIT